MKTFLILLLISVIYLAGCVSTHRLRYGQASFDALNRELEGEVGEIALADGSIILAENIKISEDSSSWVEVKSSGSRRTPTWDIEKITYKNNTRGLFELAALGALTGVSIGALIGWKMTEGENFFGGSAEPIGIYFGTVYGLVSGIVIGSVVGGIAGHREKYVLYWP
jgi:hypothetical protein